MKGITKKLMTVGLAGIMLGGVVGLAGCSNKRDISQEESRYYTLKQDIYIVHYEYDSATLHKGDLAVYCAKSRLDNSMTPVLRFNCGQNMPTYLYNPYDTKPDTS